jgi:hypothetical protein
MDWVYRGLYLIGDKKTGRITNVQVGENNRERQDSLPFAVYLARGIEPDHRTLPWQEDIETPARPEKEKDQSEPYKGFQIRGGGKDGGNPKHRTIGDPLWRNSPNQHPEPARARHLSWQLFF